MDAAGGHRHTSRGLIRRLTRVAAALLAVALVCVVVVEAVLRTDIPKTRMLSAASRYLGAEVAAEVFRTTWRGTTVLEQVTATLPIDERPSATIERITVSHRSLPVFLVTGELHIRSLTFDGMVVELRRGPGPRWNLVDFVSGFIALRRARPGPGGVPPDIHVHDGMVLVAGEDGRRRMLGPVNVGGTARGLFTWVLESQGPEDVRIRGKVGCAGKWPHEVSVDAKGLDDVCSVAAPSLALPVEVRAHWRGDFENGSLRGRLSLDDARSGPYRVRGNVALMVAAGKATIEPRILKVLREASDEGAITVSGGHAAVDLDGFRVREVSLAAGCWAGYVSGSGVWADANSVWDGAWTYTDEDSNSLLHGTAGCRLHVPKEGFKTVSAVTSVEGSSRWGDLKAQLALRGRGLDWLRSQWEGRVDSLTWSRNGRVLQLSDIKAELEAAGSTIWLRDIDAAGTKAAMGQGHWSWGEPNWAVLMDVAGLNAGLDGDMNIQVLAAGDGRNIRVSRFNVKQGEFSLHAHGTAILPSMELNGVRVACSWPMVFHDGNQPTGGVADAEFAVGGTVWPVAMDLAGSVRGRRLKMYGRAVPDVNVPLRAHAEGGQFRVESGAFDWMGGRCRVSVWGELPANSLEGHVWVQELSLDEWVRPSTESWDLAGKASVDMQLAFDRGSAGGWSGSGQWRVADLKRGRFETETGGGHISVSNGRVRLSESTMRLREGQMTGVVELWRNGGVWAEGNVSAKGWPVDVADANLAAAVDGDVSFAVDLSKRQGSLKAGLSAAVTLGGRQLAVARLTAAGTHEAVDLQDISIEVFRGHVRGAGRILPAQWRRSRFQAEWDDVDLSSLELWWPRLAGLEGISRGVGRIEPADEPRALEPLRVVAEGAIRQGRLRGGEMGDWSLVAYAGPDRVVLDRCDWEVLGGRVRLRGAVRPRGNLASSHVIVDANGMDLDQLVHCVTPQAQHIAGKVSANASLMGDGRLRTFGGNVNVRLSETDLIANTVISTLYHALREKPSDSSPSGYGRAAMHMDGRRVTVDSFYYRNRSIEVRGSGRIADLSLGAASPVDGYAFGVDHPLKLPDLFGVKELDRLMAAVQKSAATAEIKGTLGEPEIRLIPLADVGTEVRSFLTSQFGGP